MHAQTRAHTYTHKQSFFFFFCETAFPFINKLKTEKIL